jgi:hypothetical protein
MGIGNRERMNLRRLFGITAAVLAMCPILGAIDAAGGSREITSFEEGQPSFRGDSAQTVEEHATSGEKSLRVDVGYVILDGPQDWTGYDYLKLDVHTDSESPLRLSVEVRDDKTEGYWTRVNYNAIVVPGSSTVTIPTNLYVGEKSRPGRRLDREKIVLLAFGIGRNPGAPLFIDNVRLEKDESAAAAQFDGLLAFDFGKESSPLMEGFIQFTDSTTYDPGRGYGLRDADIWQAYDALQPEPLYQDFLCIDSGEVAIDLANGTYRVFMNIDSPSGFWGEFQSYDERRVLAEGKPVVIDRMDFETFNERYYRYWDTEDSPSDNTFDKYQEPTYEEKTFDVQVTDGQLNLAFEGNRWAITLSALVVYPVELETEGKAFLDFVHQRRRFHFDNAFSRILNPGTGTGFEPSSDEMKQKLVVFARDYMQDIAFNDRPEPGERTVSLSGAAFAGEMEPVTFSVLPLEDLGIATVRVSDLTSADGVIPSSNVEVGTVSYRLTRMQTDGSSYTIAPRYVMPTASVQMPEGTPRRFWLTVDVPADAAEGHYSGEVTLVSQEAAVTLPIIFQVHPGTLDPVDLPVGPWGHAIDSKWFGDDPERAAENAAMARKSLAKLRDYGFTTITGLPRLQYEGFRDGKHQFDFTTADAQMRRAREAGFNMPIVNYTRIAGFNLYYQDREAMDAAGYEDYSLFVKDLFDEIQAHADANNWLPVIWNLGDEPVGDALRRSAENAAAYRKAFPTGPPFFTAATSFRGDDREDPHFKLASALHIPNLNTHDEPGIALLREVGSDWGFYNGGNRWTYGTYLYKAAKQFGMAFRLAWHWNVVAGDPYYALDCREDDYTWCNSSPDGRLVPTLRLERLREGLDDYRMLLTLSRLAQEHAGSTEADAAEKLIADRMSAFHLGQRNHDAILPHEDWFTFRKEVAAAIASLRGTSP